MGGLKLQFSLVRYPKIQKLIFRSIVSNFKKLASFLFLLLFYKKKLLLNFKKINWSLIIAVLHFYRMNHPSAQRCMIWKPRIKSNVVLWLNAVPISDPNPNALRIQLTNLTLTIRHRRQSQLVSSNHFAHIRLSKSRSTNIVQPCVIELLLLLKPISALSTIMRWNNSMII